MTLSAARAIAPGGMRSGCPRVLAGLFWRFVSLSSTSRLRPVKLAANLSCAAAVLVMYPCSFEKPKSSLLASLCLLSFTLMTLFVYSASKPKGTLDYRFQRVAFSFAPMFLFVLVDFFRLTYKRFSAIRAMFVTPPSGIMSKSTPVSSIR